MKNISIFYIFKNLISSLFSLSKKEKIKNYLAILVIIIGVIGGGLTPLFLRNLINNLESNFLNLNLAFILILLNCVSWTLNQISSTISWLLIQKNVDKICSNFCQEIFYNVISEEYQFFIKKNLKNSATEIEKIFNSLPYIFSNICIYIIPSISDLLVAFLIFFYLYGFLYAMGLIFLFLVFIFLSILGMKKVAILDLNFRKKNEIFLGYINHILNNFEVVKAFGTEKIERERLEKMLSNFEKVSEKRSVILDGIQMLQTISCGIFIFIFCFFAIILIKKNILKPGDFVLINSYLIQFMTPLTFLGYVFSEVYRGISNLKSSFELKDKEIEESSNLSKFEIKNGKIEFKNVSFEIEGKGKILQNINLTIEEKKSIAIVGESGSGKSTCTKLILKFLTPTEGNIFVDEEDINNIDSKFLRSQISFVPQESVLFPGTIKENIFYGTNEKDFEKKFINEILKFLKLEKFIENLPEGLDTKLDGLQISGGEKQRISLARAFFKNPKICIFDEPTSALDPKTKTEIKEFFEKISGKFTSIVITHDLSLIENFDHIIVLKNGKIIEQGSHNELIKKKNYYYLLYKN